MIDFYPAASESQACWEAFLRDLYQRGLKGSPCKLMATDGGTGLHRRLTDRLSQDPIATLLGSQDQKRLGQSKKEGSGSGQESP